MSLMNLRQRKSELRAKYKRIRTECPKDVKQKLDHGIADKFLSLDEYKHCETLFIFVSSSIEVDTYEIIGKALADGKKVAVPKCRDKSGLMDFYFITSTDCLKKGAFSIMEPDPEKCELADDLSQGVCVVPGLSFDFQGYRLGFGKGYYDRFLDKFKGISVGICYSKCIEKELPKGNYDKQVDILVTEKYINHTQIVFGEGLV